VKIKWINSENSQQSEDKGKRKWERTNETDYLRVIATAYQYPRSLVLENQDSIYARVLRSKLGPNFLSKSSAS